MGELKRISAIAMFSMVLLIIPILQAPLFAVDLSVSEAVRMSLENNETYLSALQEKEKAEGQVREAWAGALPTLTFDGGYTRNFELQELVFGDQRVQIGTRNNYRFGFTIDQTLFGGGRVFNGLKIARLYDQYSRQNLKLARQEVIFGAKEAYFSAILAQDYVAVSEDAVERARENYEVVLSRYQEGLVSEFEKLSAEVELANLFPQLTRAQNNADIALNNLRYYIGYDDLNDIELDFEFNIEDTIATPGLDRSLERAFANRPDYVGQDYLIRAYKSAIGVARSGRMPSLYFNFAMNWEAYVDESLPDENDWFRSTSASLNLTFPVFDGLESSGKVKQARADYIQGKLQRQQIEDAIRLQVEEAIGSIATAKRQLTGGLKTISLAREGLRVANLRFKNGVGTQLEILAAREAVTQAETNYIQAIYDYEIAVARYEKAIGIDLLDKGDDNAAK